MNEYRLPMNEYYLPGYDQEEPDVFSANNIVEAAKRLNAVPQYTIQQQRKTPISDEMYKKLTERQLESFKQQGAGLKAFEAGMQGPQETDPVLAITSGLSDMFAGTNRLAGLTNQKSMQEQQAKQDQLRLQDMKKDLTKAEIDMLKSQYQNQTEEDQFKTKMAFEREKLKATSEKEPKTPELKDWQVQSATYGKRIAQAEDVFNKLGKEGYDRSQAGEGIAAFLQRGPFEQLKGDQLKQQEQAERNFVTATLRKESGASISPSEFATAEKQYFPRAGDSPEVLAQKKANRQQVLGGMKLGAGPAWEKIETVSGAPAATLAPDKMKRLEELRKKAGK